MGTRITDGPKVTNTLINHTELLLLLF